jgi:hypothetical protein
MPTLGLVIREIPTTEPGKFQAKISSIPPQSSAMVLVGDVIVKVNGVTVASDDSTLLDGEKIDDVETRIRQSPKGQILEFDVLQQYRLGHTMLPSPATVYGSRSHDQMHASTHDGGLQQVGAHHQHYVCFHFSCNGLWQQK